MSDEYISMVFGKANECTKVRAAKTEPYYEKTIWELIGVERLKGSG